MREFADKHPIDENPAHAFLGNQQYVSNKQAGAVVPDMPILSHTDEQNALRQVQLEKTVKGLLSRLETANQHLAQAKAEAEKKGRLVIKYENYYRELKRSVEKREQERLLACGGVDIGTSEKPTEEPSVLESETPDNTNEKITDTTLPQKTLMLAKPSTQDALPLSPLFGASAVMNLPRSKHPTTSTLEASLQRTAALEKKDRKK